MATGKRRTRLEMLAAEDADYLKHTSPEDWERIATLLDQTGGTTSRGMFGAAAALCRARAGVADTATEGGA